MNKIACITQRPIQTLILMYLIGKKNYNFDVIFYSPLKNKKVEKKDESYIGLRSLEYQCKISGIPLIKLKNLNSNTIIKISKKYKLGSALALITDTILKIKILKSFKKGIFLTHGGILPNFRGVDANKWAILKRSKFSGISLIKLDKGVDTGKIVFVKKLINKDKSYKQIDKEIYYKYKLYLYEKIFLLLKLGKKIPFQKHSKKFPQYFKMDKKLLKLIK